MKYLSLSRGPHELAGPRTENNRRVLQLFMYCAYRGNWFDEGVNAVKTGNPCNRVHCVVSTVQ